MGRPKGPEAAVLAVRLPFDLLDALDDIAADEDRSLRSVVEGLLRDALELPR